MRSLRVGQATMPLSANLSMLFKELPFLDRFAAAAEEGFGGVECWFPYDHALPTLQSALGAARQKLVVINTLPGDEAAGEWGIAAMPGREEEFRRSAAIAIEYADALGGAAVHVMAGLTRGVDTGIARRTYLRNLTDALRLAEGTRVTLLIEPLNPRDRPTYLLASTDDAASIIREIGAPGLKMMFDIYHTQVAEGDIITRLRAYLPLIGHIQVASVPERREPNIGELNYPWIFQTLAELGWAGWIGCEYQPAGPTRDGLPWTESLST